MADIYFRNCLLLLILTFIKIYKICVLLAGLAKTSFWRVLRLELGNLYKFYFISCTFHKVNIYALEGDSGPLGVFKLVRITSKLELMAVHS